MHLLITGATGLIGRRLVIDRLTHGDRVTVVSRDGATAARLFAASANPNVKVVEGDVGFPGEWQKAVNGTDAVVHLAGAGIADRRWTAAYREILVRSRLDGTHQVVNAIEDARHRPAVFVSASAVGYYGEQGDRPVTEETKPTPGFTHDLCAAWEREAEKATALGVRVCLLRIGVVLDRDGGALAKMLPAFRLGAGGRLGSGRHYFPWIHRTDVVAICQWLLENPRASGAYNASAPNPVTNGEFTRALGRELGRPTVLPMPTPALKLLFGEMAELLLVSDRMVPKRLLAEGFEFKYPELDQALAAIF